MAGAQRAVVRDSLLAEFATLGVLAGVLASAAASLLGYVLSTYVFEFPYQWNGWIWLLGGGAGVIGVGLAGWIGAGAGLTARFIVRRGPNCCGNAGRWAAARSATRS